MAFCWHRPKTVSYTHLDVYKRQDGFQCAIILPKGTNLDLEKGHQGGEDGHLTAKNKWLLGHPEGGLPEGSPMGLIGENLSLD